MGPLLGSDFDLAFVQGGVHFGKYFHEDGEEPSNAHFFAVELTHPFGDIARYNYWGKSIEAILQVYNTDAAVLLFCASFLREMLRLHPAGQAKAKDLI